MLVNKKPNLNKGDKMENLEMEYNKVMENKVAVFEIPVIDFKGDDDFVLIDELIFTDDSIIAQRIGLTEEEINSEFISKTTIAIDNDFGLDSHLEELFAALISDIVDSPFYDVKMDN